MAEHGPESLGPRALRTFSTSAHRRHQAPIRHVLALRRAVKPGTLGAHQTTGTVTARPNVCTLTLPLFRLITLQARTSPKLVLSVLWQKTRVRTSFLALVTQFRLVRTRTPVELTYPSTRPDFHFVRGIPLTDEPNTPKPRSGPLVESG